jgi:hypothetical protein
MVPARTSSFSRRWRRARLHGCGREGWRGPAGRLPLDVQPLDLREMIQIVTGIQPEQVLHALLAALRVHAEAIELIVAETGTSLRSAVQRGEERQ